jgi:TonB family protein
MTDPAMSGYYLAEVPGKGLSLQLHLGVVERLEREILDTSRLAGNELGGILLGTRLGSGRSVVIEDYQTVTRHLRKERFYDSALDRAALENAITLWRPDPDSKICVIGFFRSDSQTHLTPGDGDIASLARHLPQSDSVLLLVGPERDNTASAALYFAEGGQIRRGSPRVRFPFNRSALMNGSAAQHSDGHRRQQKDARSGAPRGYGLSALRWATLGAIVGGLVGAGLLEYRMASILSNQATLGTRSTTTLGLNAERNGSELLLSWDPDASFMASAARGHLSIADGHSVKELDLDLSELRRGRIVYLPGTDDVTFRLEVRDSEQRKTTDESVRVLSSASPAQLARPQDGMPASADGHVNAGAPGRDTGESSLPDRQTAERMPAVVPAPGKKTVWQAVRPTTPVVQAISAAGALAPVAGRAELSASADIPGQNSTQDRSGGSPRPPSLDARPPAPAGRGPADQTVLFAPVASLPPRPAESLKARRPAPESAAEGSGGAARGSMRAGEKVEDAVLLRKTPPVYPPMALRQGLSGVVWVEATVAKDGRVRSARAIAGPPLLRDSAAKAVQQWRYKPALLNGNPVDTITVTDVVFRLNR